MHTDGLSTWAHRPRVLMSFGNTTSWVATRSTQQVCVRSTILKKKKTDLHVVEKAISISKELPFQTRVGSLLSVNRCVPFSSRSLS
jgi:hypothetical protein